MGYGSNDFKLMGSRLGLDTRKKFFYNKDGGILEQFVHRGCGFSIPGNIQVQVGQGPEQPDLVGDVSAQGRKVATMQPLTQIMRLSNPNHSTILYFNDHIYCMYKVIKHH